MIFNAYIFVHLQSYHLKMFSVFIKSKHVFLYIDKTKY